MDSMRDKSLTFLMILFQMSSAVLAAGPAGSSSAAISLSSETAGACVESSTSCPQGVNASTAAWKLELQKVQSAREACQDDIDKFCEGVQVGKGRIEKCLKAHKNKLSTKCRTAQGLK